MARRLEAADEGGTDEDDDDVEREEEEEREEWREDVLELALLLERSMDMALTAAPLSFSSPWLG